MCGMVQIIKGRSLPISITCASFTKGNRNGRAEQIQEGFTSPQSTTAGVGATEEACPARRDRENGLCPYTGCAHIFFPLEGFISVFVSVPFSHVPLVSILAVRVER